ncbi:exopolysaccharide biosynthesis protein [Caulobacter sp. SLTY]|uniref:exopolysaccharide biosynthesis protein n=1 Tax=Caulobacter sp. SLTY TaxID=2683262 RepID=UPI001411B8DA|nr:exopolysaccharide biosynthesis protein [Caulobacter sp. SLTY]NBB15400.1 exopolysaccharide biosynthesis protein [Caulobacter sp. SLTY]
MSQPDAFQDNPQQGFIDLVVGLPDGAGSDGLTLGEVLDRMDERAFGILILILAVPCLVPALYGVPQIVGIPIILLAAQMMVGRSEPWLPASWLKRRISLDWLNRMSGFADKSMRWTERVSRPRLAFLATGFGERLAAFFMILATLTIVLPMTNSVPSLALTLLAVGVIQRDGIFVALGSAIAVAWVGFLSAVVIGLAFGATWAVSLFNKVGGDAVVGFFQGLFN